MVMVSLNLENNVMMALEMDLFLDAGCLTYILVCVFLEDPKLHVFFACLSMLVLAFFVNPIGATEIGLGNALDPTAAVS